MATGQCRFYKEIEGYGFVIPDDGAKDIFFMHSDLVPPLLTLGRG
jgi:cold shock CspA family protein